MKEIIFYGDDAFFYNFAEDIDVYYAKDPIKPINHQREEIKNAITNPVHSKPLKSLVNENSKIAICFDDISVPLPLMRDDVRRIAAEVVVNEILKIGVKEENISFICATGLHRKCKPKELRNILGKKLFRRFEGQIYNHDVTQDDDLIVIGKTQEKYEIEINKSAANSDLIIYLSITFTPLNGGWKSIIVGLGSYKTISPHHSPQILQEAPFMEPDKSGLHRIIFDMGEKIQDRINVFTIEMVLNNNFFSGIYKKLYSPVGKNSKEIPFWRRALLLLMRKMPQSFKSYMRKRLRANYQLIGVYAGDIVEAHRKSLQLIEKQLNLKIDKQYDVIIYGAPNLTPYNVGSEMNPLLLHTLILGYLYNMYNGKSPLKKDGTLILSNPAYEKFDLSQHPSYYDFYNNVLANTPDIFDLKDLEQEYLENEDYIEQYRSKYAYHGTHALMVYYWGVLGMKNVNNIIIAGAKNKSTLNTLGYDYAEDLDQAINQVRKKHGKDCSIAYFCIPPLFIADLRE